MVASAIAATLTASPNPVIVDVEAGEQSATTAVEYWKNPDDMLWYRAPSGPWRRVELGVTSATDPAFTHGTYASIPLEPGAVYEVTTWAADEDPNHPTVEPLAQPLASLVVFALKKRPERREFLKNEDWVIGGTRRSHFLTSTERVNAYEVVSTEPAIASGDGWVTVPSVVSSAWAPLDDDFLLEVGGLLPGTDYHVVTRLSDEEGNWQFLQREFTTKLRRVELAITKIHIDDDSDDWGSGEGYIRFFLETAAPGTDPSEDWRARGSLDYHGDFSSGDDVPPPSGQIVVGPEPVLFDASAMRLRVYVSDDDSGIFIASPDVAWGYAELSTTDRPNEDVIDRTDVAVAGPGGGGLKVTTNFKYSVKYL